MRGLVFPAGVIHIIAAVPVRMRIGLLLSGRRNRSRVGIVSCFAGVRRIGSSVLTMVAAVTHIATDRPARTRLGIGCVDDVVTAMTILVCLGGGIRRRSPW